MYLTIILYTISCLILLSWETSNAEVVYIPKDITTLIKCYNESEGKEVHLNITKGVYTTDITKLASAVNGSSLGNKSFTYWTPDEDQRIPMNYYGFYEPLYTAVEGGYIVYTGRVDDPDNTTKCAFSIPVFDDLSELHKFLDKEKFRSINETAHCFTGANQQQTLNYSLPINKDVFIGGHVSVDNISSVALTVYGFLFEYDVNKLNKVNCSSDDGFCKVSISSSKSNSSQVCVLVQTEEDSRISIDLISRDKNNFLVIASSSSAAAAAILLIIICITTFIVMWYCCKRGQKGKIVRTQGQRSYGAIRQPTEEEATDHETFDYTTGKTEKGQNGSEKEIVVEQSKDHS